MFRKNKSEEVSQSSSTVGKNWGRNSGIAAVAVESGLILPLAVGMLMTARRGAKVDAASQAALLAGFTLSAFGGGYLAGTVAGHAARLLDNTLRQAYQRLRPTAHQAPVEHVQIQRSLQQDDVSAISLSKNHQ